MKTKVPKCLKGKLPKGVKTASGEDLMKEIKGLKSKIVSSPQNTAFGNITRCDDQNELKMKLKKPKRVRKPNIYTDESHSCHEACYIFSMVSGYNFRLCLVWLQARVI